MTISNPNLQESSQIVKPNHDTRPTSKSEAPGAAIDWARLEALEERLRAAACHVARRAGAAGSDVDDVFANARLAIIDRAAEDPDFLAQTDAYVVNYGIWRAQDQLRRDSRLLPILDAEDGPLMAASPGIDPDLRLVLADLPEEQRWLARAILGGDSELLQGGRVNVLAVARKKGISWRQANNQLRSLRAALAPA